MTLDELVTQLRAAYGAQLASVVLYGSAATGEHNIEFLRIALRHAKGDQLDSRAVVALRKGRRRLSADVARRRIGNEALGALPCLDAAVTPAVCGGLLGHEQDDDARVPGTVANGSKAPDFPFATNAQCDVTGITSAQVAQRDHGDLTLGLVADILRNALDTRRVRRWNDAREVTYQAARRWYLWTALDERDNGSQRDAHRKGERHQDTQQYGKTEREIRITLPMAHCGPERLRSPAHVIRG